MTMIKITGCILIILSCSMMGMYFSNEIALRLKELLEFKKYMLLLQGDIRYASTPLPEAISKLAFRSEGSFQFFFRELADKLSEYQGETFREIWKDATEKTLKKLSLNRKDISLILSLGDTIGYLDKEMQMNTFELYLSQVDHEIAELQETMKQKRHMFNCMGVMAGIFIAIILL